MTSSTKSKNGTWIIFQIVMIALAWEVVYMIPFIQYTLYDPMLNALQCSNTQLGFLLSIYGLGNVFGAPIGGWLADKFDYKKITLWSVILNGVISILFAFNMNYTFALITWVACSVNSLVMNYPSIVKLLRVVGKDMPGKIFGFNEAAVGVISTILGAILLYVCTRFVDAAAGMKWAMIVLGIISFISALLLWVAVKDVDVNSAIAVEKPEQEPQEKIGAKDFLVVLKAPETWLVAIGIFCAYSFSCTMSYFTPYVTDVLGGSVALGGALAIIRQHGLKLVGAPFGGILADKLKSPTKVLLIVYIGGIITILLFLRLPATASMAVFIALTFVVGIIAYMGKGVYYAVQNELNIPIKYAATTTGIGAILGFSPDVFLFVLIGHWIDTYGALGYTYTFLFQLGIMVVGVFSALFILRRKKKMQEKQEAC